MKDMTLSTYLKGAALVAVLTIVISVIMLIPDWNGFQGSAERVKIDQLLDVMIVLSSLVFSVVIVMMGYAIWKYRAKPGDESDGEPIHGNTKLEITWTVIPTIIVTFGAIYSWIVLEDIEAAEPNAMPVTASAQQFAWRFDYPEYGVTSNELHVPVGRQLEIELFSLDVLHSFWVPEWGIKRDLVPGAELPGATEIDNVIRVTPTKEGTYSVVCTEYCGIGHSAMTAPAIVQSEADFEAWAETQNALPEGQPKGAGYAGGFGAGSLAEEGE